MPLTTLIRRGRRVLGELDDRSRRTVAHVDDAEHECLDVALEQGADAHRAGLLRGEDRGIGQPDRAEHRAASRRATTTAWAVRVVRLLDPIMGADDHRLVDDGDRRVGPLTAQRELEPPRAPRP